MLEFPILSLEDKWKCTTMLLYHFGNLFFFFTQWFDSHSKIQLDMHIFFNSTIKYILWGDKDPKQLIK